MKTKSIKGGSENGLYHPHTMKYFLKSGPFSTPKNAEGLPNLPPQNRDGGWSVFRI